MIILVEPATDRNAEQEKKRNTEKQKFLDTCSQLYDGALDCTTPFQEFFKYMVGSVRLHGLPRPSDLKGPWEEFVENFEYIKSKAERFRTEYPLE